MSTHNDNHQDEQPVARPYRLPDLSVGNPDGHDPLESLSWEELRDLIYGEEDRS